MKRTRGATGKRISTSETEEEDERALEPSAKRPKSKDKGKEKVAAAGGADKESTPEANAGEYFNDLLDRLPGF
ncbi:hypothetical protein, partial [Klebsiella pneumoniae]|uniref:hypothetical protein n=1 Tax=Klebsiella pneumoniae TaxID=573 RepID=UPI003F527E9D